MNQIWIVVAVLLGVLIFTRIRSQRRLKQRRHPPAQGPRIQGQQVVAFLHPRMSAACLFDHGLQFGRGFRRKEGPALPHDALCHCETVPFTFTSSEVFNGALRAVGAAKGTLAGLAQEDAGRLIERLKARESERLPGAAEAYVAAVGVDSVAPAMQNAVREFLTERFAHLRQARLAEPGGADRMESAETI